jgi:hypothetical protein
VSLRILPASRPQRDRTTQDDATNDQRLVFRIQVLEIYLEAFMAEEIPQISAGTRRNEDIALDLMKFIAITTGYGKTGGPGFQGSAGPRAEDYAGQLLELYGRCLSAVERKK